MSYVGLAIDLEQECQDICLVDEVAEYELRKQSDCLQVAGQIYGEESQLMGFIMHMMIGYKLASPLIREMKEEFRCIITYRQQIRPFQESCNPDLAPS